MKNLAGLPSELDIYAPHYRTAKEMMALGEEETLDKPIIHTEYNHALDIAFDGLDEKWEIIQKYPQMAGGMIWVWSDQGLYRKVNGREVIDSYVDINTLQFPSKSLSGDVWIDENTIMDSHGQYGTDGIVYANRVPQLDYWQARKVYSPVKIPETEKTVKLGKQNLELTCLNRYDFIDLKEVSIKWVLKIADKIAAQAQASLQVAPHDTGQLIIPLSITKKIEQAEHLLSMVVTDHNGRQIYEHVVHLVPESGPMDYAALLGASLRKTKMDESQVSPSPFPQAIEIGKRAKMTFKDDRFSIQIASNATVQGPFVRVGRKPTMAERRTLKNQLWEPPLLCQFQVLKKDCYRSGAEIMLNYEYDFSRSDTSSQKIKLQLRMVVIDKQGWIDVAYDLTPLGCKDYVQEFGLAFTLSENLSHVKWLGDGFYPAYPFKSELAVRGFYSMEPQDRYFSGNRMNVDFALITDAKNNGIGIVGNSENICWEKDQSRIVLSHNLKVAGLGTKGELPRLLIPIQEIDKASGSFRIIVLEGNNYPKLLSEFFVERNTPSASD